MNEDSGVRKVNEVLDLVRNVVTTVYSLWMFWELAKVMCPQLKVKEDIWRAQIEAKLEKYIHRPLTETEVNDFIGEVTAYVREQEDGS